MHKAIDLRTGAEMMYLTLRPLKWFNQKLGVEEIQVKMQLLENKSTVIWKSHVVETSKQVWVRSRLGLWSYQWVRFLPPLTTHHSRCLLTAGCQTSAYIIVFHQYDRIHISGQPGKQWCRYDPPYLDAFNVRRHIDRSTDTSADLFFSTFGDLIAKK